MIRVDMHVHSNRSKDGFCSYAELVAAAKKRGLDGVCFVEHDSLAAAPASKDFLVMNGEEVSTSCGHVLAYGIKKTVPRGLSPGETIEKIREQGGVAFVSHPFSLLRWNSLWHKAFEHNFNGFEGRNGSFLSIVSNAKFLFSKARLIGGSDAHIVQEVGGAFTVLNCGPDEKSVLECLKKGRVRPAWNPLRAFPASFKAFMKREYKFGFRKIK